MHISATSVPFRASCSVPSMSSFTSQLSMLQLLRCQHADVSGTSILTMRLLTVPFPWGPTGEGSGNEEGCTRPAGLEKSAQTTTAASHCQGSSPQLPSIYHQGREICIKFQSNSGSFPNCRRAHVCRHYKQDHPASDCHPAGPVAPQPR